MSNKSSRKEIERQELIDAINTGDELAYMFASREMKRDFQVALAAVQNHGSILGFISSPELRNNKEIVMAAVRSQAYALQFAPPHLQANREIVLEAVRQKGEALQWASPQLKNDRDMVLAAIHQDARNIMYASEASKANEDLVLAAVRGDPRAFGDAAGRLRSDCDFLRRAVAATNAQRPVAPVRDTDASRRANAATNESHVVVTGSGPVIANAGVVRTARGPRRRPVFVRPGTRAVERPPAVLVLLRFASNAIKSDLRATAHKLDTVGQARAFLRNGLQSRNAFMEFLLCVTSKAAAKAKKPVTKLHLDKVTFVKLNRYIAEYAGVPLGQELQLVWATKRVLPILGAMGNDDEPLGLLRDL